MSTIFSRAFLKNVGTVLTLGSTMMLAVACNGETSGGSAAAETALENGRSPAAEAKVVGETCKSGSKDFYCLALKYVVYKDENGKPATDEATAIENVRKINDVWKQCGIGFQIETYDAVNPADHGLMDGSESHRETDDVRRTFEDDKTLLVVTTGPWGTTKNAWAESPGADTYGVVMDKSVGDYPVIIAHELGHYLNLDHAESAGGGEIPANVMNYIIYPDSVELTEEQCQISREAVEGYWQKMLR